MLDRTGKIQTRNKGTAFIHKHDAVMGRIQLQLPVDTRQYPARLITAHCYAALSAVGFVRLQHFNQRCFSSGAVPSQNRNVPFQFDCENDPSASDFDSDRTKTIPNVETGFIAVCNDFSICHNEIEGQRSKIRCLCSNRPIRNPKKQFIIILLDIDLWITVS